MKALVTGADGFVGRLLVEHLEASGDEVWSATGSHGSGGPRRRAVELTDRRDAHDLLAWARFDAVYHLAAVAFGPDATADIGRALDVTVRGTAYLLEAAAEASAPPTFLVPSSGEVYGAAGDEPISERQPIAPLNPYGATKAAQETIALAYHRSERVPVAVTRSFNHIGPGQRPSFVVASFASQLAAIDPAEGKGTIQVGNLSAVRDFTDVRDVVRAYRLIVAGGHVGEPINVASGRGVTIRALLDELIEISGLDVAVSVERERLRPVDVPVVIGSPERLRELTGWTPRYRLRETLSDVWHDARARSGSALAGA